MIFTPPTKVVHSSAAHEPVNWVSQLIKTHRHWWGTEGEGVIIAVLDSGINENHEAFKDAILDKKNFTGTSKEDVTDNTGHGTHVAGIIAARKTDNNEMHGIAPKAQLLIAKVIDKDHGSWESATEAINWVIDCNKKWKPEKGTSKNQNVWVINMSFSGVKPTSAFYQAVHTALAEGICIITAAGNLGAKFRNGIGYPGRYGGVITIAAHDEYGRPSPFSSSGGEIDFMAPGSDVWSTYISSKPEENSPYAQMSGTSMAAPFIAGLSALIISKHINGWNKTPIEHCEDLRHHLMRMATHPGLHDAETGYGPLDVFQYFGNDMAGAGGLVPSYLYGRKGELKHEIDDRYEYYLMKDKEFWRTQLLATGGESLNIHDLETYQGKILAQADCVGIIIDEKNLHDSEVPGMMELHTETLNEAVKKDKKLEKPIDLCDSVRFKHQGTVQGRTGFLIKDGLIVTARHGFKPHTQTSPKGIYQLFDVSEKVFVLGYRHTEPGSTKILISKDSVFKCLSAIGPENPKNDETDWCVIKITPTKVSKSLLGKVSKFYIPPEGHNGKLEILYKLRKGSFPIYTLGHPFGLPLKFTNDGFYLGMTNTEIHRNDLDLFPGNSGSPVFDAKTNYLVGIATQTQVENQWTLNPKGKYIHNPEHFITPESKLQDIARIWAVLDDMDSILSFSHNQ